MRPRWKGHHASPHYLCTTDAKCPTPDGPGAGHVCVCSCRRCSIVALDSFGRRIEICICRGCDARDCGLHNA